MYVAGFSLGANQTLRMVGSCSGGTVDSLKGICVVGAPFDVLATGFRLKYAYWGLIDSFIK